MLCFENLVKIYEFFNQTFMKTPLNVKTYVINTFATFDRFYSLL
jgi:hypothetical protein